MKLLKKPGILILGLLPVLVHFLLLGEYSFNFPLKDDYRVITSYLYHYLNAPDKFLALGIPENESRPVLMRIITLVQFYIDGAQNYKHLLLFCNLFLLVFFSCIAHHFYKRKEYVYFVCAALLVFNPIHYEMYFRNDVGTYQTFSFALAIFLFYVASYYEHTSKILRGLFFLGFILTPLGSINGLLASILILYVFFYEKRKVGWILLAVFVVQVLLVLSGDGKSLGIVENLIKYNFQLVYAYALALGGTFAVVQQPLLWPAYAVLGGGIFGYTVWKLFFPWGWKLSFEKLLFLFCAASLALIVILRYNYWIVGYVSVLESRYKIYGAIIILLGVVLAGRRYGSKVQVMSLVGLSILFVAGYVRGVKMLDILVQEKLTEAYNVNQDAYEDHFALRFFVNKEKRIFLEEGGHYSFGAAQTLFDRILTEENLLKPIASQWTKLSVDPGSDGDWYGMQVPMSNFELRGTFPRKKYYFVKFHGEKSCIQFLLPGTKPFWERTSGPVEKLSRDFYADAYEGVDFSQYSVYGVDELGR
jgi:hypothetical protein